MIKTRLLKQMLIVLLAPGLFLALALGYVWAIGEVYMVRDINPAGNGTGFFPQLTNVNDTLFFVADDGIHGAGTMEK